MYEDRISDKPIADAKEAIFSAQVVIFLGFGFDPDNIARLDLNNTCVGKLVGATRYKVAQGDWIRTTTAMKPTVFNVNSFDEWDSLAFLHGTNMFS
jgi:hypothetical protein